MSGSFSKGREIVQAQQRLQSARKSYSDPVPCEVIVAVEDGKTPRIVGVALSVQGAIELTQRLRLESSEVETGSSKPVEYVRVASVLLPR